MVLRGLALLCGGLGIGGYALGVTLVALAQGETTHGADSSPAPACWMANLKTTVAHEAGYFPLRFDCELADGTTHSAGVVSGRLTPVTLVLVAVGGGLALERRRREVTQVG